MKLQLWLWGSCSPRGLSFPLRNRVDEVDSASRKRQLYQKVSNLWLSNLTISYPLRTRTGRGCCHWPRMSPPHFFRSCPKTALWANQRTQTETKQYYTTPTVPPACFAFKLALPSHRTESLNCLLDKNASLCNISKVYRWIWFFFYHFSKISLYQ